MLISCHPSLHNCSVCTSQEQRKLSTHRISGKISCSFLHFSSSYNNNKKKCLPIYLADQKWKNKRCIVRLYIQLNFPLPLSVPVVHFTCDGCWIIIYHSSQWGNFFNIQSVDRVRQNCWSCGSRCMGYLHMCFTYHLSTKYTCGVFLLTFVQNVCVCIRV